MPKRRTFCKTSVAARAALRHGTMPDGRILLSRKQWAAAAYAMGMIEDASRHPRRLAYTTAEAAAVRAGCSRGVALRALHALKGIGLLRSHPASGSRPEMFLPAAWP